MEQRQPGAVTAGILLVIAGLWVAASSIGLPLAGIARIWPGLLFLIGLPLLIQFALRSTDQPGLVPVGLGFILLGMFMCFFTLELSRVSWSNFGQLWPVLLVIIGASMLAYYAADGYRSVNLLIPAYLIGGIGLVALPFTLGIMTASLANQLLRIGPLPLALIIISLFLRPRNPSDSEV